MPGKHRGEKQSDKRRRERSDAQAESDATFFQDVAEAAGVLPHDPDDPRVIKAAKKGRHRRG